jgi:hypothetical protein
LGTLILSVDLEADVESQKGHQERQLDEVRRQLLALAGDTRMPATWAVADPMLSAAREGLQSAGCGHEIAVLGDRVWLGKGCGRERLSRELARRFSAARKAGIPVSTLVLRNVDELSEVDLLLHHGVTAVCGIAADEPAANGSASPLRYGLWQPPVGWRLPLAKNWWSSAAWMVRRRIQRAIRKRTLLHLRLDAARFIAAPSAAFEWLGSLLRYAVAKREAGHLAIKTIGDLAAQSLQARAAQPSRSILRPAA